MRTAGVIVTFDGKEYSEEETIFLYQRFFEVLGRIAGINVPENYVRKLFEGTKNTPIRTRTPQNHSE